MRSVIVLLAFVLAVPAAALAQPGDDPSRDLAKKHFETGNAYYSVANYKEALAEFEKAYKLTPLPGLLFNIGRCHENLGNLKSAIDSYKRYLELQKGAAEPTVKLRIDNLEKRLAEQTPAVTPPEKKPEPPPTIPERKVDPQPEETTRAPVDEGSRWKRTAGWVTLGVGVASLVTGIAFGAMVRSKNQAYQDGASAASGWKTYDQLQDLRSSAESYQKVEIGMLVVGGVLAAAGTGLVLWDAFGRKPKETASASIRLLPMVSGQVFGLAGSTRF